MRRTETEFFHCLGCSLMFLEPELFTAAPDYRKTATQPPVGAPAPEHARRRGQGALLDSTRPASRWWH